MSWPNQFTYIYGCVILSFCLMHSSLSLSLTFRLSCSPDCASVLFFPRSNSLLLLFCTLLECSFVIFTSSPRQCSMLNRWSMCVPLASFQFHTHSSPRKIQMEQRGIIMRCIITISSHLSLVQSWPIFVAT